jgi:hypothetical protein
MSFLAAARCAASAAPASTTSPVRRRWNVSDLRRGCFARGSAAFGASDGLTLATIIALATATTATTTAFSATLGPFLPLAPLARTNRLRRRDRRRSALSYAYACIQSFGGRPQDPNLS